MLLKPAECRTCPIYGSGEGFSVPLGNLTHGVAMVGEALGEEEEKLGLPFQGRAGEQLTRMVERLRDPSTGLAFSLRDFRLYNTLWCRPPGNLITGEAYEDEALRSCAHFLADRITQEQPRVLLALGNQALRRLTGHWGIDQLRGYYFQSPEGPLVIGTYHPSYIMRGNFELTRIFQLDLLKAVEAARGKIHRRVRSYVLSPDARDLHRLLGDLQERPELPVAFDIETPYGGIDSESKDSEFVALEDDVSYTILRISFSHREGWAITMPWMEPYAGLAREILALPNPKVSWNGCVTPETLVLKADLSWVPAGTLKVGDELVGFDSEPNASRLRRRLRSSTVLRSEPFKTPLVTFKFSDGSSITSTPEHPFLVPKRCSNGFQWKEAGELKLGDKIARYVEPWQTDLSREAGYIAGFMDGEGSLCSKRGQGMKLTANQNEGVALETFTGVLRRAKVPHEVYYHSRPKDHTCNAIHIGSTVWDQMEFLGKFRPERLLEKFRMADWGTLRCPRENFVTVIGVETSYGVAQGLATSSETYISEGFASHNSGFDVPRLVANGVVFGGDHFDAMHMWHALEPSLPMGLKYVSTVYCPDMPPWRLQARERPEWYNAADSDVTLCCYAGIRRGLESQGRWPMYLRHFVAVDKVLRNMSSRGITVDPARRQANREKFRLRMAQVVDDIQTLIPIELRPRKVYTYSEERLRKEGKWLDGSMVPVDVPTKLKKGWELGSDGWPVKTPPPPKKPRTRKKTTNGE